MELIFIMKLMLPVIPSLGSSPRSFNVRRRQKAPTIQWVYDDPNQKKIMSQLWYLKKNNWVYSALPGNSNSVSVPCSAASARQNSPFFLDIPNCKLQTALPLSNYIHILTPKEDRKKHNYLYFSRISQICRSGGCYIYILDLFILYMFAPENDTLQLADEFAAKLPSMLSEQRTSKKHRTRHPAPGSSWFYVTNHKHI